MEDLIIYIAAGVTAIFSSLVGAFAGGGSSLVLLPILLLFVPGSYLTILTTTKVSAAIMTFTSAKIHYKKGLRHMKLLWVLLLGSLLGTAIGTYLVQFHLNESLFKKIMALVMFVAVFYLLKEKGRGVQEQEVEVNFALLMKVGVVSLLINILNGMIGGTGIFITILLVTLGFAFIEAVAYTMINYALINAVQVAYLLWISFVDWWMILAVILGSAVGGFFGTHLQYLKGNVVIKRASVLMMIIIALKMLEG